MLVGKRGLFCAQSTFAIPEHPSPSLPSLPNVYSLEATREFADSKNRTSLESSAKITPKFRFGVEVDILKILFVDLSYRS